MRRFNDDENEELFPDMDGNHGEDIVGDPLELMKLNLVQIDLNQKLLNHTVRFLERTWFWRLRTNKKKLGMIIETYNVFKYLVTAEFLEDEDE